MRSGQSMFRRLNLAACHTASTSVRAVLLRSTRTRRGAHPPSHVDRRFSVSAAPILVVLSTTKSRGQSDIAVCVSNDSLIQFGSSSCGAVGTSTRAARNADQTVKFRRRKEGRIHNYHCTHHARSSAAFFLPFLLAYFKLLGHPQIHVL